MEQAPPPPPEEVKVQPEPMKDVLSEDKKESETSLSLANPSKEEKVEIDTTTLKKEVAKTSSTEESKKEESLEQNVSPKIGESIIIKEEIIDFSKVDKKQYDTVNTRMQDYRDAAEYYHNNGVAKKAQEFLKKTQRFKACLDLIKTGKKIDLLMIDPPLTPEFFLGQETEIRRKAIQALIGKFQGQLSNHRVMAAELMKDKKNKEANEAGAQHIEKGEKAKKIIAHLNEIMNNPWIPIPQFRREKVETEKEIVQTNIEVNALEVQYTPDKKMEGSKDLKIEYLIATKEDSHKNSFEGFKPISFKLTFPKSYKHIERGEASFTLIGSAALFFTKNIGTSKVKLEKFASQGQISVPFEAGGFTMEIALRIRKPTKKKEIEKIETEEIIIDKFYPSFREQHPSVDVSPPTRATQKQTIKPLVPQEEIKQKKLGSQVATQKRNEEAPKKLTELPPSLREVDVKDPDDIGNLIVASYLDKKITLYTSTIKQLSDQGNKVPPALQSKLLQMTKNKAILSNQISSGKLTPDKYKQFIQNQLSKDQILFDYFKKNGLTAKMNIVKERIICIQNELKSF